MSSWTHTIIESYCMYKSMSKQIWTGYSWKDTKDMLNKPKAKPTRMKNPGYIPKEKRPVWCKRHKKKLLPQYKCLEKSCPFFAYTDAMASEYMKLSTFDDLYKDNKKLKIKVKNDKKKCAKKKTSKTTKNKKVVRNV